MPSERSAGSPSGDSPCVDLVHFEGPWSGEEKETVTRAAQAVEASGLPEVLAEAGRPWVATKHVFQTFTLLMAKRIRMSDTLTAQDATLLAAQIEGANDYPNAAYPDAGDHPVFQLMYQSEATGPMDGEALHELLRQARAKNHRLEVTGVLLYKAGGFVQVLEGDEETVRALYATIQEDPRHESVETLLTTSVKRRVFPDWSMGVEDFDQAVPADEPGVTSFLETGRLPTGRDPLPRVARALEQFKERGRTAR